MIVVKTEGRLSGIKIIKSLYIINFLVVDDVIIFGRGSLEEYETHLEIISLLCVASGMEVSTSKSCFLKNDVSYVLFAHVVTMFPFKVEYIDYGLKYLRYFLNNGYRVSDWMWLVKEVEKRIGNRCYRLLSLGGRLTSMRSILVGILVF